VSVRAHVCMYTYIVRDVCECTVYTYVLRLFEREQSVWMEKRSVMILQRMN